jgi:pimeloyl-ACP methyl ester carboxylesterase
MSSVWNAFKGLTNIFSPTPRDQIRCVEATDGDVSGDPARMASLILCMWSYEERDTSPSKFKLFPTPETETPAGKTLTVQNLGVPGSEQFHLRFDEFVFQEDWAVTAKVTKLQALNAASIGAEENEYLGLILAFRGTKPATEMMTWPTIALGYVPDEAARRISALKKANLSPNIVTGHSLGAHVAFQYMYWQFNIHIGAAEPSKLKRAIVFDPAATFLDGTNDLRQNAMRRDPMLTNSEVHYTDSDPILAGTSEQMGIIRTITGRTKSYRYRAARFKTFIHVIEDKGILHGHNLSSFLTSTKTLTPEFRLGNSFTDTAVVPTAARLCPRG